jgi:hypothetical protein
MLIKIIISTSVCLLIALSSYQFQLSYLSDDNEVSLKNPDDLQNDNIPHLTKSNRWSVEVQEVIQTLSDRYSDKIHLLHIQAKLITIREPLIKKLSVPSEENLKAVLASAFPNYENSILDVWSRMDAYEKWLLTENRTLMELNAVSRSEMLWDKRNQLFPIAAANIWSEEQDQYETAQLNFHSEVDQLDRSYDTPMSEKIQRLQSSFKQADNVFTRSLGQQSGMHKNTIASVLFGLTSVQKDLQQLEPEQRQLEINAIRRELGYDEDTIIKMSTLDNKREQRWNNGYAYMESRDQLIASSDHTSEIQLNELRSQFFGNSAETIEREETSGFYRFQRPRYYGRN